MHQVSERAAFAYGSALNALLADRSHSQIIGDTTIVYWSEHGISACQDFMMSFLGNDAGLDDHTLDTIVTHMIDGLPVDLEGIKISPDEPFYILGLAPNAARISVRLFLRNTFRELVTNLSLHQDRMKLEGPSWEKQNIPLWKTLKATANPNGKEQAASPLMAGSLFRTVLQNTKYPESVFQNIMLRVFADRDKDAEGGKSAIQKISHTKAAFIKAYLLKNGKEQWEGKLQMALNENCNDISYVLGRMFSLLENIQQSANPTINTTIKERYFNSACATPASVFPILLKLANTHLSKLDEGKAVYFKKKMGALMDKIIMPEEGIPFPSRLTLEEQGAFILGYYQETQARYKGKLEQSDKEALAYVGIDDIKTAKKKNPDADRMLRDFMCSNFFDIRTFGAVMTTFVKGALNCGQVRGPVQLGFARSIDPIAPQEITLTRIAITTEEDALKKKTEIGRKFIVPYALYQAKGYISANLARKVTHFSEDDLNLLWQAIINMFENDHSAARGNMAVRELIVFKHASELGNAPSYKLFERVHVARKDPHTPPRSYSDYEVQVDTENMPQGVTCERKI